MAFIMRGTDGLPIASGTFATLLPNNNGTYSIVSDDKNNNSMKLEVGDLVKFIKSGNVPPAGEDYVYTIGCVHSQNEYYLADANGGDPGAHGDYPGNECSVHKTSWVVRDGECEKIKKKKPVEINIDVSHLDRVVIDKNTKEEILSVLKQYKHSNKIFEEWGLGESIEYGKGMTMLFHGNPGTGKTWMGMNIAKCLGLELQIVDTAMLQSSEPGQMERNLKGEFAKAKRKNSILLFDECDSLVMSRNNVGMIVGSEINCLLTEIEKFEGVCILTTNRIAELDAALERRISLIVDFPDPTEEQRLEIWTNLLPKKMPLAKDVDLKEIASDYEITGGLIKNAILNAARIAVSADCETVSMEHFQRAIQRMLKGRRAFAQQGSNFGRQ